MNRWNIFWLAVWSTAAVVAANNGGGVTKHTGLTKFWTNDYKIFDQIYGRTSDRDLYGVALPAPASTNYGIDANKFTKTDALKLKTKQHNDDDDDDDTSASGSQIDAYGLGDNFANLMQRLKYTKDAVKPTKVANPFLYNVYKPVSEDTDPETFDYLKHLEQLGKQESIDFPQESISGFQPYIGAYRGANPAADNFKSIQDILEAQDIKAKQKNKYLEDDEVKYVNYGSGLNGKSKKQNVRLSQNNDLNVSRCGQNHGRCRKRSNSYGRYASRQRSRPAVVRTIKHIVTQ